MDDQVGPEIGPEIGQVLSASQALQLAIKEARRGAGFVSPNPVVGCSILDRSGRLLSVGHHARVGFDHAEVDAIKKLSDRSLVQGAHLYVTLEPCAHQGRTPSCARTLAELKPASVTYAVEDPNPLVSGKGAEILRAAGVKAQALIAREDIDDRLELIAEAEELAEIFLFNQRSRAPFIAVKVASSLDGRIALNTGESKWITGEKARLHGHSIRARYDAVAVGRATVVADDPSLNVRHPDFPGLVNRAIVFDPEGKTLTSLKTANLLKVRGPERLIVVTSLHARLPAREDAIVGLRILQVPLAASGFFRTDELFAALQSEGVHSFLIEGGAQTTASFFTSRAIQRIHAYLAPSIIGGTKGKSWSEGFGIDSLGARIHLDRSHRQAIGDDLYWTAKVRF